LLRASGFTPATLGPILDGIENAYQKAAETTVESWPKVIQSPIGPVVFTFDMRNPEVEQNIRTASSLLITRISDEVRENVRATLESGVIRGENPRTVALDIVGRINPSTKQREGGVIGLTERQTKAVDNIRRSLEQGQKKYFEYELRDKRFDKLVKKSIDTGIKLKPEEIEKLVTAYKTKALRYRGEMIARTETAQAFGRAEWDSIQQAIKEGIIKHKFVEKSWQDTSDGRTRTTHRVMGEKYKYSKPIGIDEPFVSPSGARLNFPGDTSLGAPAAEVVACRCRADYNVRWIDQAKEAANG